MSDLGQQGLFDITRTLLQQPDLGALSDALTRLVRQSALADSAAIVLWHSATHRASYFSTRDNGKIFEYEDETFLAHGPVRRILSRPEALHCNFDQFRCPPKLAESNLYHPFGHYSMLPLAVEGQIFGGCEFIRDTDQPRARRSTNACTPLPRLWPLSRSRSKAASPITWTTTC